MSEIELEQKNLERENMKYPLEDKYVCADCFDDEFICAFINDNADKDNRCSYCEKKNAASIELVLDFIYEKASRYFVPVEDDDLYLTSSFFDNDEEIPPSMEDINGYITFKQVVHTKNGIRYMSNQLNTDELLEWLDLGIQNNNLYEDIRRRFEYNNGYQQTTFVRKDSYLPPRNEELISDWRSFEKEVSSFALSQQDDHGVIDIDIDLDQLIECIKYKYDDFFQSLRASIYEAGLVGQKLNDRNRCFTSKELYRCRRLKNNEHVTSIEDIVAPKSEYAQENRMTSKGESVLYVALDENTTLKECKVGDHYAIGILHPMRDFCIVDLFNIPTDKSYFSPYNILILKFLREYSCRISQDNNGTRSDYLPTQVMTKILRDNIGGLDGIMYKSAKNSRGANVVLFCNHDECLNPGIIQVKLLKEYDGNKVTTII